MTGEEALALLRAQVGKPIWKILEDSGTTLTLSPRNIRNKGLGGLLLEAIIGKAHDSHQRPDLDDGTEVKKASIERQVRVPFGVKETVQVTMINRKIALPKEFSESHLYSKTRKILLVPTLYAGKGKQSEEILLPPRLWIPSDSFNTRMNSDYTEVLDTIADPKKGFDALTGSMGQVVEPRTKGSKSSSSRAFYFKTSAVKEILGESYFKDLVHLEGL
jgi:DNA mismatch repair protein MutH